MRYILHTPQSLGHEEQVSAGTLQCPSPHSPIQEKRQREGEHMRIMHGEAEMKTK